MRLRGRSARLRQLATSAARHVAAGASVGLPPRRRCRLVQASGETRPPAGHGVNRGSRSPIHRRGGHSCREPTDADRDARKRNATLALRPSRPEPGRSRSRGSRHRKPPTWNSTRNSTPCDGRLATAPRNLQRRPRLADRANLAGSAPGAWVHRIAPVAQASRRPRGPWPRRRRGRCPQCRRPTATPAFRSWT